MRTQIYFIVSLFFVLSYSCKEVKKTVLEPKVILEFQAQPKAASLRGIFVVDTNVIWLSGSNSTVLRTLDGGKNWENLQVPTLEPLDFRDVEAFSDQVAIIVSAGYPSRVFKTKDGGINWSLVHENSDSNAFMNSIFFKSEEEGLIFGDKLGDRHLVLKTIDGGDHWERLVDSMLPVPLDVEHGYAASGSCIVQNSKGDYIIGLGGEVSRVYIEGEKKWTTSTTTLNGGGNTTGIYSIANGNDLLMAVGGDYLKPDSSYMASISKDGGVNWLETNEEVSGYRSVVNYSKKYKIWVTAGINGLDFSFNEGETWTYLKTEEINTLQFDSEGHYAWAADSNGKIYKLSINFQDR